MMTTGLIGKVPSARTILILFPFVAFVCLVPMYLPNPLAVMTSEKDLNKGSALQNHARLHTSDTNVKSHTPQNISTSTPGHKSNMTVAPTKTKPLVRNCVTGQVVRYILKDSQPKRRLNSTLLSSSKSRESANDRRNSFNNIFKNHVWIGRDHIIQKYADVQSSGPGSLPANTRDAQAVLNKVIEYVKEQLQVTRIKLLDIPCGDMVWMNEYLRNRNDIDYIGVDIVGAIIDHHKKEFSSYKNWTFLQHDIAASAINIRADLILSRMMLQHLSNFDTQRVLQHLSQSGSKYLLTSSFVQISRNTELASFKSFRFRPQNLELPPFSLVAPNCLHRDADSFLALWPLPLMQAPSCMQAKIVSSKYSDKKKSTFIYSCT